MAAVDAQLFWLSAVVPNDQFLVYAFDGEPDVEAGLADLRRRAEHCPQLGVRVCDERAWRYPRWVPAVVDDAQFAVHTGDLESVLAAVAPLDATRHCWRVHVVAPATVVVQISHALGDGTRSAALAAALLGRREPVPPVGRRVRGALPRRAVAAALAHRRMLDDTRSGRLPPPAPPRSLRSVNGHPSAPPVRRSIVLGRDRLGGPTVTVAVLTAIGAALGGYLTARGEPAEGLGAELPIADPFRIPGAHNNFHNAGIGLYPELDGAARAARIAADLAARRRRAAHPAVRASAEAFAATPALLLRWGMSRFDDATPSATVSGHTVVSSVNRGAADLSFGGSPVRSTAGFPALSPMMSLTHGVHGIGDTVTVSVHADPVNVDVGDYLDRLAHALGSPV